MLPEGHLDAAIYHCQQAAEKAVKGFLAFRDHQLERTHDIERLVSLAMRYEPEFSLWIDAAITLTPYATAYRYPGLLSEPTPNEFEEALNCAIGLVAFVFSLLPADVQPD
jgi:HEPN domain-containing protein